MSFINHFVRKRTITFKWDEHVSSLVILILKKQ